MSEIDLQVQWRRNNVEYLSIPPRELFPRVRIDAKLPYTVPDKNPMQYLARLENLDVTLRLKPKQGDELILPLTFNVGQIHEPIEKRLKTLATHNQRLSSQAIDMLIDYTRSRPEE